jgi:hypothetical protein
VKKALRVLLLTICLAPLSALGDECVDGDCINGNGTMVFATGHKYSGGFKDGLRHGEGVLLLPGGRKIVGVWVDNEIREGIYTEPDGTRYEGQWQFRERNGQGTLWYPDGRKYTGAFKSGRRHGKGTLSYPDGRRYAGDFFQGSRTGVGTMSYPDGSQYTGQFKNGKKDGHGTLTTADGRKVEGEFRNGRYVGK